MSDMEQLSVSGMGPGDEPRVCGAICVGRYCQEDHGNISKCSGHGQWST